MWMVGLGLCLLTSSVACAGELSAEEKKTIQLFETVSPSVAFIKNASLQWDWFSAEVYEVPQGAGSGFFWDEQGHIVTNFHVIYQADRIEVTLADQKTYPAQIVGFSPDHDLAVLKIDAPRELIKPVKIGSSEDLKVGQNVISIGNPFGLDYSLTTGVVSALGRSIKSMTGRKIHDVIQSDAAINPGNSGGPLLDSSGELIGVSTAIYSPTGTSAGIGFAIPVNVVKRVVPQLIQYGKVKRIGLGGALVPDHIRKRLGLEGALLLEVLPGSGAERAGLRGTRRNQFGAIFLGDIITAVDGKPVKNNDDLTAYLEDKKKEGDKVELRFLRNRREFGTTAILQSL